MKRTRIFAGAIAVLGTCVAIACTINPQPLPPSADQASDASTLPRDDGALGAFGDSGGGSSGTSSGGSSGGPGADATAGNDGAPDANPPPEAGTDAPNDGPEDAPEDG